MRRLANDSQKLAELRREFQGHIEATRKFIVDYSRNYNANRSSDNLKWVDECEIEIINRMNQLDQTAVEILTRSHTMEPLSRMSPGSGSRFSSSSSKQFGQ